MGKALADVYIMVYCDRQLSQIIAFLLPIFPNLVPFLNVLVFYLFSACLIPYPPLPSPLADLPPLSSFPVLQMTIHSGHQQSHPLDIISSANCGCAMLVCICCDKTSTTRYGSRGIEYPLGPSITGNEREKLFFLRGGSSCSGGCYIQLSTEIFKGDIFCI